jgi:hypothetical protein
VTKYSIFIYLYSLHFDKILQKKKKKNPLQSRCTIQYYVAKIFLTSKFSYKSTRVFVLIDFKMCASDNRIALQYAEVASYIKLTQGNVTSWPCVDLAFGEYESFKIGPRCF